MGGTGRGGEHGPRGRAGSRRPDRTREAGRATKGNDSALLAMAAVGATRTDRDRVRRLPRDVPAVDQCRDSAGSYP